MRNLEIEQPQRMIPIILFHLWDSGNSYYVLGDVFRQCTPDGSVLVKISQGIYDILELIELFQPLY